MEEIKKNEYTYMQLIAGALLVFGEIDNIDGSLLVKYAEKAFANGGEEINFKGSWECIPRELVNIIKYGMCGEPFQYDPKVYIVESKKPGVASEEILDNVKRQLEKIAGDEMIKYFRSLDIEGYQIKKEKRIEYYKKKLPNRARVLLISQNSKDYDELAKRGYNKISWFKSIVRAEKYFEMHPEQLEDYNIIILGYQCVSNCIDKFKIEDKIQEVIRKKHIALVKISRETYFVSGSTGLWITDSVIGKSKYIYAADSDEVYDSIVECALTNFVLDRDDEKSQTFEVIQDYVNPKKLPLPMKKADVKILYLADGPKENVQAVKTCTEAMGLNVDVFIDDNYGFVNHIRKNLGNYDIIIASENFSDRILNVLDECREQCKDTGRQKVVLATYRNNNLRHPYLSYGKRINMLDSSRIHLEYVHDGKSQTGIDVPVTYGNKCSLSGMACNKAQAILSTMMHVYNGISIINDLDLKTVSDYAKEYDLFCICQKFEEELRMAMMYFNKRNNLVRALSNNLAVEITDGYIAIAGVYKGKVEKVFISHDGNNRYVINGADKEKAIRLMEMALQIIAEWKQSSNVEQKNIQKQKQFGRRN